MQIWGLAWIFQKCQCNGRQKEKRKKKQGHNLDEKETNKRHGDHMQFLILDGVLDKAINKN